MICLTYIFLGERGCSPRHSWNAEDASLKGIICFFKRAVRTRLPVPRSELATHQRYAQQLWKVRKNKIIFQSYIYLLEIRVRPDIRQCRNMWYPARKSRIIRQGMPDSPDGYPTSGKKNQIRPNPTIT